MVCLSSLAAIYFVELDHQTEAQSRNFCGYDLEVQLALVYNRLGVFAEVGDGRQWSSRVCDWQPVPERRRSLVSLRHLATDTQARCFGDDD